MSTHLKDASYSIITEKLVYSEATFVVFWAAHKKT